MAKNLLIVESPAKAKTIEKILGKDFMVKSCYGHIRDLAKKEMGIDVNNNFEPTYIISEDKEQVVKELQKLAKNAEVWLATDEDREGEAISWHLCEVLDLDKNKTKRIVFNEITAPAIKNAVANPRKLDQNLFYAQQARRVLDRVVGFELSPVLWKKLGRRTLSAGRVQSVAVRLVVEREREINNFNSASFYKVVAYFLSENKLFKAELSEKLKDEKEAQQFLEEVKNALFKVADIQVKPTQKSPAAPFTTSTLQQEASRKLGFSVSRTMSVAQKLYESGKITYMRTDSPNLSDLALNSIQSYITKEYGKEYSNRKQYASKHSNAQEAHEAIRPTYIENTNEGINRDEERLYDLIWKRTIASQMSNARLEKTVAKIDISTRKEQFIAEGEVLKFEGFLKVYLEGTDDEDTEESGILPPLSVGQNLQYNNIEARQRFTQAPARFTEASLIKKLEELGIGRPSTYAPTISTIQNREYVVKGEAEGKPREYQKLELNNKHEIKKTSHTESTGSLKGKLIPTDIGLLVTDYLMENFSRVMDYSFTAEMEKDFDEIAEGNKQWSKILKQFYGPFHKEIQASEDTAFVTGERELGIDKESGKTVVAKLGRYGPMIQIGNADDEEKPRYAKLKSTQSIETISLDEAMELFKLPLVLGTYEGQEIAVNIGRFGPYVKFGEAFISLPKGEEPTEVTLERAIEVIKSKQVEDAPIAHYQGKPITKGKGRFGPFIKWDGLYINIPVRYKFDTINEVECADLIEKKIEKEANRFILNFPEEKISVENGRWGPFIKFNKKMLKLSGKKYTAEEAALLTLEEIKSMIEAQVPNAFAKATAKKATSKKTTTTKASTKKTSTKKK
ncbi:MAG TPA: type I DNA topoisomerase [Chitinophagales bacterium]|nr:type I DNA topoisomerase [Chitinophagales bacterium]HNO03155.1 type I DNA topoisomerase [Chitinophagales bacterium]